MSAPSRKRVRFSPEWKDYAKWAIKFIRKNRWRCEPYIDHEDLLQEAYLTFQRIRDRYPDTENSRHFLALYSRAMSNEMHDRSRHQAKVKSIFTELTDDMLFNFTETVGEHSNYGYLNTLLEEAPQELRLAMIVMDKTPELLRDSQSAKNSDLNVRLSRILGIEGFDFIGAIKSLLTA